MRRLIVVRVGVGLLTLLAVSLVVFLGTQVLPGDAARAALGQLAPPDTLAALRKQFGLDRPVLVRYGAWLWGLMHGDLGRSLPSGDPVVGIISDRVRNTVALTVATIGILVP